MSVKIPPAQEDVTNLGTWALWTGTLTNPSTQTLTLGPDSLWNVTFPQVTTMRLQPCTITKILITSNGGAEWTSGTMRMRIWKNNTARTPPADFDSGNLSIGDMVQVDFQANKWFDVNIPINSEDDYLTASMDTIALTGGPEGQRMIMWGIPKTAPFPAPSTTFLPIVETNANGTFEKYADGRLICYAQDPSTRTTSSAIGQVYRSSAWVATFPHAFIAAPLVSWSADYVSGTSLLGAGQAGPTTTTQSTARINGSVNSSVGRLQYVAHGFWK